MTTKTIAQSRRAAEMILDAIYFQKNDDMLRHSFLFGEVGASAHEKNFGTDIYYDSVSLTKASVFLRENGASRFSFGTVSDVWSEVTDFVAEHFIIAFREILFVRPTTSLLNSLSDSAISSFVTALSASTLMHDTEFLTVFPLYAVQVKKTVVTNEFFLAPFGQFPEEMLPEAFPKGELEAKKFPPFKSWSGRVDRPNSIIGVRSIHPELAGKRKATVLGSISLLENHNRRYMLSGRKILGGVAELSDVITVRSSVGHTPPIMGDIELDDSDLPWLHALSVLLKSGTAECIKKVRALEYVYRAWFLSEAERYPVLFSALDAIFGDQERATKAILDGTTKFGTPEYDKDRIRMLLSLRASTVHGGSPNIHESKKYQTYYSIYHQSPVENLEYLASRVLRLSIFAGLLVEKVVK